MRTDRVTMLSAQPRVSVVIPCYNYGHFLQEAIASAFNQELVQVQIIVVDDASTDDSASVARNLALRHDGVTLIEHTANLGHIATFNHGLGAASGEYVTVLSADDLLTPGALDRAAALLEADQAISMVYGVAQRFSGTPPTGCPKAVDAWSVWQGDEWAAAVYAGGTNIALSPEVVLRTSVQTAIGGYDVAHPHASDLHMWLRAASVGRVGFLAGPVQALYREHASNMHSEVFAADQAAGMANDLRARDAAFRSAASLFPDGSRTYASSRQAIGREALDLASRAFVWGLTDTWPVEDLVELAIDLHPSIRRSAEWRAFDRRRRFGSRWSRRNPAFIPRERWLGRRRQARETLHLRTGV